MSKLIKPLLLQNFNLAGKKEFLLLKKKNPKVRVLNIPLKGSSVLTEHALNSILKKKKPLSSNFKTLSCIKTRYVSYSFLKFFEKNKQILKAVKSFAGNIGSLSNDNALSFIKFINQMKYVNTIDDTAKFHVQNSLQPRKYRFTFPASSMSKKKAAQRINGTLSLKGIYPMRNIKLVKFSPYLQLNRLFPNANKIEIEVYLLEKIPKIKNTKIDRVTMIDKHIGACHVDEPDIAWQNLAKFPCLKELKIRLLNVEILEIEKILQNIPNKATNIYFNMNPELLTLNEYNITQLLTHTTRTDSKIYYDTKDWLECEAYKKLLLSLSNAGSGSFMLSHLFLSSDYSPELQKLIINWFSNSDVLFKKFILKLNAKIQSNQVQLEETSLLQDSILRLLLTFQTKENYELIYNTDFQENSQK